MGNNIIINEIENSGYLPEIPKAFGEILEILLDPYEFNMELCIRKFYEYPQLENELIKSLNYNSKLNKEILTIKDAIVYLGARNVKLIAISYITRLLLPNEKGRTKLFNKNKYWRHCIGTSIAAYLISQETELSNKDKMFTYGLIHDIGITVLDICLPEYLDKIYKMQLKGLHQIAAEKVVLKGATHSEVGMWLCEKWGLPEELKDIIGYHHTPFNAKSNNYMVYIMHLADSISANYYETLLGNEKTFIYSQKILDMLELDVNFVNKIANKMPKEIDKLSKLIKL